MDYQAPGGRGCYNCGESSHQARDCPKRGTPTCYNCGEEGHEYLPEAWAVAIPAAEEVAAARSVTNAEKSATLLVTAPKVVLEATRVVDTLEAEGMAAATGLDAHNKPATPAADTDTCLVIAPRDRNATTAEKLAI
ncbi:MAG: hypothetical protein L6R36_007374 [Xanthoria steineri]|nr:MAG: hypothetical protein L6R36_007374 [Xanthoria steineri]